jgi:hypothetical protein
MIIQEEVDIRIGNKEQIEHYSKVGYQPDWKKVITVKVDLLELKNETRWQTVRELGDDIVILKSKEEIKNYVDNIVYNIKINEIQ